MLNRRIIFDIDHAQAMSDAVDQYKIWQNLVYRALQVFVEQAVQMGMKICQQQIAMLGAIDTGELYNSITGDVAHYPMATVGHIRANAPHAAYVEYGTGVIGSASPHPEPGGWAYDINGHGLAGWVYPVDDGNGGISYRRTRGMPSRAFMYYTKVSLQAQMGTLMRMAMNSV